MHTDGWVRPETEAEAREIYADCGSTAQILVRELARAMAFDDAEYEERVTSEVVETAREVLFAERLAVQVGTREAFEEWRDDHDQPIDVLGSEHVDSVAWHAPPFSEGVAATFSEEEQAAFGTLRRQAFGRIYRDIV
jgi:hypothetical protein